MTSTRRLVLALTTGDFADATWSAED